MTNPQLLVRFFADENKRDWQNFHSYLHPQVMWFVHTEDTHAPVAGREDFLDYVITYYKEHNTTFTCELSDISASGNRIAAYLKNSDGSRIVKIFDFEDGLIKWVHEFTIA